MWVSISFIWIPDTGTVNDLLFYSCHPSHLSLESEARCISHWLHQSTFSVKGQPVSFGQAYDYTAEGILSGLPHMTWLPAAHSDTGAASIARQPLALVYLTELVPRCTGQPHPYFRMTPLIKWHNQCNLLFGSRVGRRPYSLNLWKTACRLAYEKLTLALHYQDVQVREETIPQTQFVIAFQSWTTQISTWP